MLLFEEEHLSQYELQDVREQANYVTTTNNRNRIGVRQRGGRQRRSFVNDQRPSTFQRRNADNGQQRFRSKSTTNRADNIGQRDF